MAGFRVAVDQADLGGQPAHAGHKADQIILVGVGGIARQAVDARANADALAVEVHVAAAGAVGLDRVAGGAAGLVAHEEHVVARVVQHRLEVVHHPPAGAHAAGGDHHRRVAAAGQAAHVGLVVGVLVDGHQLLEGQRLAPGPHPGQRLGVPEGLQRPVFAGEAPGQRRIQIERQLLPLGGVGAGVLALAVQDVLELIQQLLGAADAEGRHDHRAAVGQRPLDHRLQALAPAVAVFVEAVAVGALQHHNVGRLGGARRRQHRRPGRAEVTREHHPPRLTPRPGKVALHVGRPQDVPRPLQADAAVAAGAVEHRMPRLVGQRPDARLHHPQVTLDEARVPGDPHRKGIRQHDG